MHSTKTINREIFRPKLWLIFSFISMVFFIVCALGALVILKSDNKALLLFGASIFANTWAILFALPLLFLLTIEISESEIIQRTGLRKRRRINASEINSVRIDRLFVHIARGDKDINYLSIPVFLVRCKFFIGRMQELLCTQLPENFEDLYLNAQKRAIKIGLMLISLNIISFTGISYSLIHEYSSPGQVSAVVGSQHLRIIPKFSDGKILGHQVLEIQSDSLPYRLGLRNGDIIRAIDGVTEYKIEDVYKKFSSLNGEKIVITVERSGFELELQP